MANVFAIHSVGQSLMTYLSNLYPEELKPTIPCDFGLISSRAINKTTVDMNQVTLYLYRVTVNEHLRNLKHSNGVPRGVPLSVDLHYLLSVWAENALDEQVILAWTMRQLHLHPVLDRSSLSPEAAWDAGDVVQLIPAELSNEDVMRIWDALTPPYHLSVSYIARVIRVDPDAGEELRPVVNSRLLFSEGGKP